MERGTVAYTNDVATQAKRSCVEKGYYEDEFIHYFTRVVHKEPIICRGYYARVQYIRRITDQFIAHHKDHPKIQILSLGAGFDTNGFRVLKESPKNVCYYEYDQKDVVNKKARLIMRAKEEIEGSLLGERLEKREDGVGIQGTHYQLIALDMNDLAEVGRVFQPLSSDIPTLLIAECVFVYIDHIIIDNLLTLCKSLFPHSYMTIFDPCNPHDRFGSLMIGNLSKMGAPFKGIYGYPTREDLRKRYSQLGYHIDHLYAMHEAIPLLLTFEENIRLDGIERLDELEEWYLILDHYYVTLLSTLPSTIGYL